MTEPYPFLTSADEFADKRVLVTGATRGKAGNLLASRFDEFGVPDDQVGSILRGFACRHR